MDDSAQEPHLKCQWTIAAITGGTAFILLFWATLRKILLFYGYQLELPDLGVVSELINSFSYSFGALVIVFFPLIFIYSTVQAYGSTPTQQQQSSMKIIKAFLFSYALLIVPNLAKSVLEGLLMLFLLGFMASRSDILYNALIKKR